ncbi:hypothetical protein O6H91_16G091900 [Diphasiastrum complanatum]|uniref:Uncharacterized protein n=7 Tax=Diphasiastrum complanatum TaxID=34168 RepID=A0ACC2BFT8_DIPCM|nr:hypothetical protein O6H91_16G091900 [Diphasiastrum complanatum]KAJ7528259.1 hypothetical protein O6H91_16G091900 [Diphasiastrum complanatum]KAJ7528260.1 hypothetical protein O6H91_16G091900 [Diphasiastrum complanatum]KAJ7528261.1 hypothetical protein O6H91_16G091900 [Diphasiastrum complanatum]KAJ7528262.1 hypothetical protein O6H91_16G091900 [Diphasiastrum complanatum]
MRRFCTLVQEGAPQTLTNLQHNISKTLDYLEQRHVRGSVTCYSRLLKECIKSRILTEGKRIHNRIVQEGLDCNRYLGNLLISMYGKCENVGDARKVFDGMPERNVVTWTAMIGAYSRHGHTKEALQLFQQMQQRGIRPNKITFLSILNACRCNSDLGEGRSIHRSVSENGLESDTLIGTALVTMYSRCGSLKDSRELFDKTKERDVVSWNAMIAAYVQNGNCWAALSLFHEMQAEGVKESKLTYATLLKACGLIPSLSDGKLIHSHIIQSKYRGDLMVNNAVLNMYSRCGSLADACEVFDSMKERDLVTWNTMAGAYAQQENASVALEFVELMEQQGLKPDRITWLSILDACCGPNLLAKGKLIHGRIVESGHHLDVAVANSVMSMYARCGSLELAQTVFGSMSFPDLISWNTLIQAFAQYGRSKEALELFEQMQQEGLKPNKITFLNCLSACATPMELSKARQLHALILADGLELDTVLGTALLSMYGRCGSIKDAQEVFENLPEQDVATWTAIIGVYAQNNCGESALKLFKQMIEEGVQPNKVTFVSLLNACNSPDALAYGRKIHSLISKNGLESDIHVGTALVKMYALCGNLEDACLMFSNMNGKDVVAWNTMISAYVQYGLNNLALKVFDQMHQGGIKPNRLTFVSTLKACGGSAVLEHGEHIHACIIKYGLQSDSLVENSLIDMYSKCGNLMKAHQIFDKMSSKDVITWNTLIAAYAQHGYGRTALRLFAEMEQVCATPDEYTFVSILDVCASLGLLTEGKLIHARVVGYGFDRHVVVCNALINMYGKCGSIEEAWLAFLKMFHRNTISCNIMIATYAQHGLGKLALQVFGLMQWVELQPDEVTYTNVLSACSHAGLIDEGSHYFVLRETCGIVPRLEHYRCIVDLFGRAKQLDEAEDFMV